MLMGLIGGFRSLVGRSPSFHVSRSLLVQFLSLSFCFVMLRSRVLRNGPDKNDSINGNEHFGIQLVCKKVITFLLSVLTSYWLKQQTVNKTS